MANENVLSRLRILIDASMDPFTKAMTRAKRIAQKAGEAAGKAFSFGWKKVKQLGLAAIVAGGSLLYFSNQAITSTDSLGKMASRLDVSAEMIQKWRFASDQAGFSAEGFDSALQKTTRRLAEAAQGTGEALQTLQELGLQLTDSTGKMLPIEDILFQISDKFSMMSDQATKVRYAVKLFDDEAIKFVNVLDLGSQGILDLHQKAEDLGLVLSNDLVKQAEDARSKLDEQKAVMGALATTIAVSLAPVLMAITGTLAELITRNQESIQSFSKWVGSGGLAAMTAKAITGISKAVADLIVWFGNLWTQGKVVLTKMQKLAMETAISFLELENSAVNKMGPALLGPNATPEMKDQLKKEREEREATIRMMKRGISLADDEIDKAIDGQKKKAQAWEKSAKAVEDFFADMLEHQGINDMAASSTDRASSSVNTFADTLKAYRNEISGLIPATDDLANANNKVAESIDNIADAQDKASKAANDLQSGSRGQQPNSMLGILAQIAQSSAHQNALLNDPEAWRKRNLEQQAAKEKAAMQQARAAHLQSVTRKRYGELKGQLGGLQFQQSLANWQSKAMADFGGASVPTSNAAQQAPIQQAMADLQKEANAASAKMGGNVIFNQPYLESPSKAVADFQKRQGRSGVKL